MVGANHLRARFRIDQRKVAGIGVESRVQRRPRIDHVPYQQVEVHILVSFERGQRSGIGCLVLGNEAQREFPGELVVPARSNDVVGKDVSRPVRIVQLRVQVGEVVPQAVQRPPEQFETGA